MSGIWIKFFPTDWITGVMYLSDRERGVYITLLAMMYDAEGPIPDDPKRLARACGSTPGAYAAAMRSLLNEGKIHRENGMLFNEKAREILLDRSSRVESAKNAAEARHQGKGEEKQRKKSAGAMRADMPAQSGRNATAMRPDTEAEAEAEADARRIVRNSTTEPNGSTPSPAQPSRAPPGSIELDLRAAADWHHEEPRLAITGPIDELLAQGADLELDVIPVVKALAPKVKARRGWTYFVEAIREAWQARLKAAQEPHKEIDRPTPATPATSSKARVLVDSPEWEAWAGHAVATGKRMPTPRDVYDEEGRRIGQGWYFDTQWPPTRKTA